MEGLFGIMWTAHLLSVGILCILELIVSLLLLASWILMSWVSGLLCSIAKVMSSSMLLILLFLSAKSLSIQTLHGRRKHRNKLYSEHAKAINFGGAALAIQIWGTQVIENWFEKCLHIMRLHYFPTDCTSSVATCIKCIYWHHYYYYGSWSLQRLCPVHGLLHIFWIECTKLCTTRYIRNTLYSGV